MNRALSKEPIFIPDSASREELLVRFYQLWGQVAAEGTGVYRPDTLYGQPIETATRCDLMRAVRYLQGRLQSMQVIGRATNGHAVQQARFAKLAD